MQTFTAPFLPLSDDDRQRSIAATLEARPDSGDLWVFAYGGLMWNPDFPFLEDTTARLDNWHRALCVWTALARGTPTLPGLGLGLLSGGVCDGVAYRIAVDDFDRALPVIWHRELWTDIYDPTWVRVRADDDAVDAVAFTVNRQSAQFADGLNDDAVVRHIAMATGQRGRCRDYIAETVKKLKALGIAEPELARVLRAVDAFG